jgi:hypothetical protein
LDFSVLDKYKNNLAALLAGVIIGAICTWQVTSEITTRDVKFLERQLAEVLKQSQEKDARLSAAQQATLTALARVPAVDPSIKREHLESLIKKIDVEIAGKLAALAAASPLRDGPPGKLYLELEKDIDLLKRQRDEAAHRLIEIVGGR